MKEKLLWAAVFGLGISLALAAAQTTRPESPIGRYQIVGVQGYSGEESLVLKLDTVTGKTWVKGYITQGDSRNLGFVLIPDAAGAPTANR